MPHNTPLVLTLTFIKSNPPYVETHSIRVPPESAHRDVLKCAEVNDHVDIFDEDAGRRFKGTIFKKLYRTGAVREFEIDFTVLED